MEEDMDLRKGHESEIVIKIVDEVFKYNNKTELSWTGVFKDVLKRMNLEHEIDNNMLLIYVVRRISKLGYDIIPIPFRLEYYR